MKTCFLHTVPWACPFFPQSCLISLPIRFSLQVDIYSLGVLFWELVTRKAPWEGRKVLEFLQAVVVDGARLPLPAADEVCPLAWRSLIRYGEY